MKLIKKLIYFFLIERTTHDKTYNKRMNLYDYLANELDRFTKSEILEKARNSYAFLKYQLDILTQQYTELFADYQILDDENRRLKQEVEMMQASIVSIIEKELAHMTQQAAIIKKPIPEELM